MKINTSYDCRAVIKSSRGLQSNPSPPSARSLFPRAFPPRTRCFIALHLQDWVHKYLTWSISASQRSRQCLAQHPEGQDKKKKKKREKKKKRHQTGDRYCRRRQRQGFNINLNSRSAPPHREARAGFCFSDGSPLKNPFQFPAFIS